jgi:hypothetical protein
MLPGAKPAPNFVALSAKGRPQRQGRGRRANQAGRAANQRPPTRPHSLTFAHSSKIRHSTPVAPPWRDRLTSRRCNIRRLISHKFDFFEAQSAAGRLRFPEGSVAGRTVKRASLRLAWQSGRRQFGSDRGHRQHWKLETSQGPVSSGAGYGIRGSARTVSS